LSTPDTAGLIVNRSGSALKSFLIGAAIVLAVLVVAIVIFTRTEFGVERFRQFAIGWVDQQVHGTVRIGGMTSRGLLGGLTLHDLSIVDEKKRPFLTADSATVAYSWRTLLSGRIVLGQLDLYRPQLVMEQLPRDTAWNFEYIFADTIVSAITGRRKLIEAHRVGVIDGRVWVRLPFEVDGPIIPSDTARLILEPAPGGTQRVMRFDAVNGRLSRVVWSSPEETGKLFQVSSISTRGYFYQQPFQLRDARGIVSLRDTVVAFDVPFLRLPASTGSMYGRVISATGENIYDVKVETRTLAFADIQWIYPPLPNTGGGSMNLRIQTLPAGTLWQFDDVKLRAPGTNLAGSLGFVYGDSTYFTRVNLRASPFNVKMIEEMLPEYLPVRGLMVGTVVVEGPLSWRE
jgi:hypothetical protein